MKVNVRRSLLYVVVAAVIAVIAYFAYLNYEGMVVKSANSYLQGIGLDHEHDRDANSPLLMRGARGSRYVVLGLPTGNHDFPRYWIILNATPGGRIVTVSGDDRFEISCSYLKYLRTQVDIKPAVQSFLSGHCHP